MSARLDAIEARLGPDRRPSTPPAFSPAVVPSLPVENNDTLTSLQAQASYQGQASGDRDVSVIIQPLNDLSLARVVEQALSETEGVETATLRELRGNSAIIDARVDDGVSIISSLRRKLPVAFDVTDSDNGSFTIAMAQPGANRTDGVAGQQIP